jgi:hypothetical protein
MPFWPFWSWKQDNVESQEPAISMFVGVCGVPFTATEEIPSGMVTETSFACLGPAPPAMLLKEAILLSLSPLVRRKK